MNTLDYPFMLCGINTKVVGGGVADIFPTTLQEDPGEAPSPSAVFYKQIASPYAMQASAYSYDWNDRLNDGSFRDLGGPTFVLYGNSIERCGLKNWRGLALRENESNFSTLIPGIFIPFNFSSETIDHVDDASPNRSINGPQGCKADQYPNGCIMIVPVGTNHPWCPTLCVYDSLQDSENNSSALQARYWGVFYVTYDSVNNEYQGRMIKNYPMHTDGEAEWTRSYVGPLNITLVQVP